MDAQLNQQCATLRAMSSAEAAQWLLREYPAASPASAVALQLIPHRSWQRSEQRLLAEHYLTLSFASARPYQAFCSIMPTRVLADWVAQRLPQSPRDRSLLAYLPKAEHPYRARRRGHGTPSPGSARQGRIRPGAHRR